MLLLLLLRKGRHHFSSWSQRQSKDIYVKMARNDDYRARSAYKLIEIWNQFPPPKPKSFQKSLPLKILDIGSSPGSWSQVAQRKFGDSAKITAIDLKIMEEIPSVSFHQVDFNSFKCDDNFSIIMSDMAPPLTGIMVMDYENSFNLVMNVISFTKQHLNTGGLFIMKHFIGPRDHLLLAEIKDTFKEVKFFIPKSSRKTSSERYLIGTNRCK